MENITREQVLDNLEDVKKYIEEAKNKKEKKVVGLEIKNRWTGDIIFTSTKTTWKEAVEEANLCEADLCGADLGWANLRGANLDFSCWPLWCGSLDVKLDKKQKRQLLYHVLAVAPEYRTPELLKEANKFHKIPEVPKLEGESK